MATIVEPPIPKRVKCRECAATIAYLPEDVVERTYSGLGDYSSYEKSVKCPRDRCPGKGIIMSY